MWTTEAAHAPTEPSDAVQEDARQRRNERATLTA